jgi:Tol biopolymer transport system component
VFTIVRAGDESPLRRELWSVRVANGKALDAPELLKADVGPGLGFSQDGSFYFEQSVSRSGVYVAEVDPATWKLRAAPKQISDGFRDLAVASPAWSPDGKSLAYVSNLPSGTGRGEVSFVIRNADSGQRKEVPAHYDNVATAANFRWFPDSKSLLLNGPPAPRLLDLSTGRDRVLFNKRVGGAVSSPDGRSLFYITTDAGIGQSAPAGTANPTYILRRDLETGEEKELYRNEATAVSNLSPSPDGRYLAFRSGGPSERWLLSTSGGEPRELSLPARSQFFSTAWAPDSKSVIFFRMPEDSTIFEIWVQPIDGSDPHGTGIVAKGMYPVANALLSMLPDGRITFMATVSTDEVWVMKNLFAGARAAK